MTILQNAIIGFPRWTPKCTIAGSSPAWNATYPLANLLILPLSQVARSVDASTPNTQFSILLDKARVVSLIALVAHNISVSGTWQIKLWSDAAMTTLLYDSGAMSVWPVMYPYGSVPWGDPHWWGGLPTSDDIANYTWTTPFQIPNIYAPAAVSIYINDTGNSVGYVQIGEVEIAQAWQFGVNLSYGFEFGFKSRSIITEALGGTATIQRLQNQRMWSGLIDYLTHTEAMTQWFEHSRQLDISDPFIFWLDPLDTANQVRNCALVRLNSLSKARRAVFANDEVPFDMAEVL